MIRRSLLARWMLITSSVVALSLMTWALFSLFNVKTPEPARVMPVAHADPQHQEIWLIAGSALEKLAHFSAAQSVLDHPSTWVSLSLSGRGIPYGWHITPFVHFASEAALVKALRHGTVPKGIKGLGYDNEGWSLTPLIEQQHPAQYVEAAAAIAHHHHWAYLQLGNLPVHGSPVGGARFAQIIDLQVQSSERIPAVYLRRVRALVAAARHLNPHVLVIAGLSTNPPPGTPVSLNELETDIQETRRFVNGYWLNIPTPGLACPRCGPQNVSLAEKLLAWIAHQHINS
ncbi:hypothetical protein SAMN00768000_2429 [Sulfobacillus thermosulfidooxidans DSM 9293]|uniref:Uncharacterized protein n=2 Tax=Sulfobacillus thermosulfidooxidans TaxID=28034 RepID=A0A1W1WHG8_SULTA|nr:hypothetical protein [Sulfobacillus thermosulfidooxidans]PSR24902.1 MAG: hypothetical protein C7B47_13575 [Sulfobacillus thermosulfidooxidans]SMC05754.1 hypothetical protein SAMN00768000_2429 [Sulfobacillus thermosulfidooxidans DSM 9293]